MDIGPLLEREKQLLQIISYLDIHNKRERKEISFFMFYFD